MNPQFIPTDTVDNHEANTEAISTYEQQQHINAGSLHSSEESELLLGDEYLPNSHITPHPFSLTSEELSSLINNGQEKHQITQAPQALPSENCSFPTDYSVGKNSSQSIGDSKSGDQPEIETPKNRPLKDYSFPTDYSVGKLPTKPVGGSGWLHKYTSLKETKTGLVEYPRVKEGKRSRELPQHWYWNYCWHKKGKNGQPLYKKGKAVVECIGCPQKKVRAVERAIAARLPLHQILEIIKGKISKPPPT